MPVPANLVHQLTTGTGTGNLPLTAVPGKQTFGAAFPAGTANECDYFVSHRTAAEWEYGTAHVTAGALVRDTVIGSSNANAAVNFSAGDKDVTNDIPAAKQVTTDTVQTLSNKTLDAPALGTPVSGNLVNCSGSLIPGDIIIWPLSTARTGTLMCDGAAVSRTTYSALFAAISTNYGAGDGSTTFNLPNYRGEFLRGWANGSTNDPDRASRTNRGDGTTGDAVGTKQADQFKSHTHPTEGPIGQLWRGAGNNAYCGSFDFWRTSGATGGNETRPRNTNVNFCIAY